MKSRGSTSGMLFDWRRERHASLLAMLAMGLASLALHALGFYVVQVVYPTTTILRPPQAVINLQVGDQEGGLATWLAGQDPALLASWSLSQLPPPVALLSGMGRSLEYHNRSVRLLPMPAASVKASLPDALPSARPARKAPSPERAPTTHPTPPTPGALALEMQSPVAARTETMVGRLSMPPDFRDAALRWPLPRALVQVNDHGLISRVFLTRSTGDHSLDVMYAKMLSRAKVKSLEPGWHWLEFTWRLESDAQDKPSGAVEE